MSNYPYELTTTVQPWFIQHALTTQPWLHAFSRKLDCSDIFRLLTV